MCERHLKSLNPSWPYKVYSDITYRVKHYSNQIVLQLRFWVTEHEQGIFKSDCLITSCVFGQFHCIALFACSLPPFAKCTQILISFGGFLLTCLRWVLYLLYIYYMLVQIRALWPEDLTWPDPQNTNTSVLVIFILIRPSISIIIRVILSYSQCLPRGSEFGTVWNSLEQFLT